MTPQAWTSSRSGGRRAITIPVGVAPEEASRRLAPLLRALRRRFDAQVAQKQPAGGSGPVMRVPVVTVDGYSGSGKSTLARALAAADSAWQVLHMDDWYPGWDGLDAGARVARAIAADLRAGRDSSYVGWDWEADAVGRTRRVPARPTIIEGCGAVEADADLMIWLADPGEAERRRRALARDGATYAPHWQRWAAQDLARFVP